MRRERKQTQSKSTDSFFYHQRLHTHIFLEFLKSLGVGDAFSRVAIPFRRNAFLRNSLAYQIISDGPGSHLAQLKSRPFKIPLLSLAFEIGIGPDVFRIVGRM